MFDTFYHHSNGISLPYTKHSFWQRLERIESYNKLSDNALYLYLWLLFTQDKDIETWPVKKCAKSFKKIITDQLDVSDNNEPDYLEAFNDMVTEVNEKKNKQLTGLIQKSKQDVSQVAEMMNMPELTTFIQQLSGALTDMEGSLGTT